MNLEISGLKPCACTDHALVHLKELHGDGALDVKVEISTAQAILAELNGIPSQCAVILDLFAGTLRALAMEITGLTLHELDGERPIGRLELGDCDRPRILQVPAGTGLLVASRVGCPVRRVAGLPAPATPEPPEPFRAFLETLDLSELDGGERS